MNNGYDAFEFEAFMEEFLKGRPDVVRDRQTGWDIYWNPRNRDQAILHIAPKRPLPRQAPGTFRQG